MIPLLDLQPQYAPLRNALLEALTRVCDSQRFIMGAEVEALERELATYLSVDHAIGVSSGTDALLMALMALEIGPGDEVITTPYSFFATAGSIVRVGARPVFADIDAETCNLDPVAAAAAITSRTRAIIPVHLYGQSADLDPLVSLARERGIAIIEDAAQAIGARDRGRLVGSVGDIGCFSFFPSKNLGAFGDAGLLTTNHRGLAARLRLLRNHGMEPQYLHHIVGGNFRLDALQAAVLRVKLPHLDRWSAGRRANADRYRSLLTSRGLSPDLVLPQERRGAFHVYNQFVVHVPARDAVRRHLQQCGIGTEVYYPVPLHLQPCFASLGYVRGAFPIAEDMATRSLALPIFAELSSAQLECVVEAVSDCCAVSAPGKPRDL